MVLSILKSYDDPLPACLSAAIAQSIIINISIVFSFRYKEQENGFLTQQFQSVEYFLIEMYIDKTELSKHYEFKFGLIL
jgi:hypothetical protein